MFQKNNVFLMIFEQYFLSVSIKTFVDDDSNEHLQHQILWSNNVCGTVSSMLSGLKTRSLGLNTLGTT